MSPERVETAIFWSSTDVLFRLGIQFVVTVILARLIAPVAFGIVALLTLFVGVAGIFVDSGFSAALIQRRDHTPVDENTVFWFNVGAGAVIGALLVLFAPLIARFFGEPVLVPMLWAMALNICLGACAGVHAALLTKRLDFRTQTKATLVASLVSGTVAIAMAMHGWGIWALALQMLTATAMRVSLLWWMHPWRPKTLLSLESFHRLFRFGGFLLLSSLLDTVASRLYTLVIGKFYSLVELGYYDRATNLKDMPQTAFSSIYSRILFPTFSSQAHDPTRLRGALRASLIVVMAINLPIMLGLLGVAEPLVPILLGPQWVSTVPFFQVLCVVGMLWPLHVTNLNALMAQGHSRLFFRLDVIKKVIYLSMLIIASQLSVLAIAWGSVVTSIIAAFINSHYTRKFLNYSVADQGLDIAPYTGIALIMLIVVSAIGRLFIDQAPLVRLLLMIFSGAIFYALAICVLRLEAYRIIRRYIFQC